ncbi:hypothetical protein KBB27_04865 [Patescibacteria group bacterium]|nr:hypothetical protein [Patescibacteria group bacterium]
MRISSSHRSRRASATSSILPTAGALLIVFVGFYFAVRWFRSDTTPVAEVVSIENIAPAKILAEAVVPEAALFGPDGSSGVARRSEAGGVFSIAVRADLPEIDRTSMHYEGWLLRKSPYDFFSFGEMVTDDEGMFIVSWEGKQGDLYVDYNEVIVTREVSDGNPDPSTHVLKGVFE